MTSDPGAALRALHRPGDPFVLANAWDAGSARVLAALGAQAIGTTSAGFAFTRGEPDGARITLDDALAHAGDLVAATGLPVSGDLENGYAAAPDGVARTIRRAAGVGLAGASIEDTDLPGDGAHPFYLAVERVRAAAAAARALAGDFVLVARADGLMTGAYDLGEATARAQAFAEAGADCVYVPMLPGLDALAALVAAVPVPVNALAAGPLATATRADRPGRRGAHQPRLGPRPARPWSAGRGGDGDTRRGSFRAARARHEGQRDRRAARPRRPPLNALVAAAM